MGDEGVLTPPGKEKSRGKRRSKGKGKSRSSSRSRSRSRSRKGKGKGKGEGLGREGREREDWAQKYFCNLHLRVLALSFALVFALFFLPAQALQA